MNIRKLNRKLEEALGKKTIAETCSVKEELKKLATKYGENISISELLKKMSKNESLKPIKEGWGEEEDYMEETYDSYDRIADVGYYGHVYIGHKEESNTWDIVYCEANDEDFEPWFVDCSTREEALDKYWDSCEEEEYSGDLLSDGIVDFLDPYLEKLYKEWQEEQEEDEEEDED